MAQFDVFHNKNHDTKNEIPFLLDIQASLLDSLATRVVVPLAMLKQFGKPAKYLNPIFTIDNKKVVMMTPELAGVSVKILGNKVISLSAFRQDIMNALDFLITGI